MSKLNRIAKLIAAVALTALLVYSVVYMKRDWDAEEPFRARAAESRRASLLYDKIYHAKQQLSDHGADIARCKGTCPAIIDLTKWNGTNKELQALRTIARLPELRLNDNLMYLKLGPAIDSSALQILRDLKNLRRIEVNGAKLTEADVQDLLAALPDCTLGEVSWDALFPPLLTNVDEPSDALEDATAPSQVVSQTRVPSDP
jgi:hypothetical protein